AATSRATFGEPARSTPSGRPRWWAPPGARCADSSRWRPAEAGMHLMGWLPAGVDDRAAARAALARDVDTPPLPSFRVRPARGGERGGLVLGYAAYTAREIDDACARLALALRAVRQATG